MDPAYIAYMAGSSIAQQATDQILPNMSRDLEGTDDSISAAPFHAGFLAGVKQDTTLFKADKARELFEKRSTAATPRGATASQAGDKAQPAAGKAERRLRGFDADAE